ncbi:nucleoside deaminase [Allochromatium vinosum]|uniref:CMP/dCMP deaminase zinc-binding protein n=1 Tax=Allochromatium vinosum (strain ATCC 17899 / DSM 180 / NBRC 103801 / NCIMB 10441 / D) TaxID=572477 RepID=D3RT94_ALLVD|nr:nucleoside deaminase [Allochromatium vinosum]ADC62403.1 CMP/dCMP deaminase zinc-binding protein [Allochromatium vinosum DSM 180]
MTQKNAIRIELPAWIEALLATRETGDLDDTGRMALVLDLARENIRAGADGPFSAAIFERRSGRLIAAGVNRVVSSGCSIAHAEMVAIGIAQQRLGSFDLRQAVPGGCVLFTSAEPCAMCMGAIPWSGIERVVIGARDSDVRAIGFDEGHKPADWIAGYAQRGIEVTRDLLRAESAQILWDYAQAGGAIY